MQPIYDVTLLLWGDKTKLDAAVSHVGHYLAEADMAVAEARALPPYPRPWRQAVAHWLAGGATRCLLTVGGAGPGRSDVVPDVAAEAIARPAPGIPEALRGLDTATADAMLFRGLAGLTADGRLIVNLPDGQPWLDECLKFLAKVLPHALEKAGGDPAPCGG